MLPDGYQWLISGLNMITFSIRVTPFDTLSLIGKNKKSRPVATDLVTKVIGFNAECNKDNKLNEYEFAIASQVINPNSIKIDWSDIGGQDDVKKVMKTDVICLIKNLSIIRSFHYYRPPKGILLYGPPGTGKTMLAQATAKESNANFINLDICSLTNKWYSEPIKLARAVFTLAKKISPCIIFIEEIDSFLSLNDRETNSMMKSKFLQLWDNFSINSNNRIIVMGTTNHKFDIDEEILSRMDLQFEIKLPDVYQRTEIFKKMLKSMDFDDSLSIEELAILTDSFSGRDMESVCREVNMRCLRECQALDEKENAKDFTNTIRKVNMNDFIKAIELKRSTSNFNRIIDYKIFNKIWYTFLILGIFSYLFFFKFYYIKM